MPNGDGEEVEEGEGEELEVEPRGEERCP